jgi:hypothetical protein
LDERHGRLDVLINNAAIDFDTWQRSPIAPTVSSIGTSGKTRPGR